MTDVDDYMTMLRESQLKRTIVVEDVDKIISENKQLKELLKECRPFIQIGFIQSAEEEATRLTLLTKINEALK